MHGAQNLAQLQVRTTRLHRVEPEPFDERRVTTESKSAIYWVAIKPNAEDSSYTDESVLFRDNDLKEVLQWVEDRMSAATQGVARVQLLIPGGDLLLQAAGEDSEEMHGIQLAVIPASGSDEP